MSFIVKDGASQFYRSFVCDTTMVHHRFSCYAIMSGDIELVEHNRSWKWAPMNDPNIGYVNWCFCAACLVPGICGNGKCEVVQNGTLVSSFKCVCDPGYANILNMTAGYCANQCKFVLSGFCLFEYSQRILHHSILSYVKLFLWYDCTRIIWMDYLSQMILH